MSGASRCSGNHRGHRSERAAGNRSLPSWCHYEQTGRSSAGRAGADLRSGTRSALDSSTLLVYVMDIYDPWSYAYLPSVSAVLSAACTLVDVEVIHAGRYDAYTGPALIDAIGEVGTQTSASFGDGFFSVLRSGQLSVNACSAAAAVIALLATEELPVSTVLSAVQHEFFVNGSPIESPGTLTRVATRLGLDAAAVELFAGSSRARELATEDFEMARDLDARGGPLLLASRGKRLFEFDGLGATPERLVDQFMTVLAKQ